MALCTDCRCAVPWPASALAPPHCATHAVAIQCSCLQPACQAHRLPGSHDELWIAHLPRSRWNSSSRASPCTCWWQGRHPGPASGWTSQGPAHMPMHGATHPSQSSRGWQAVGGASGQVRLATVLLRMMLAVLGVTAMVADLKEAEVAKDLDGPVVSDVVHVVWQVGHSTGQLEVSGEDHVQPRPRICTHGHGTAAQSSGSLTAARRARWWDVRCALRAVGHAMLSDAAAVAGQR